MNRGEMMKEATIENTIRHFIGEAWEYIHQNKEKIKNFDKAKEKIKSQAFLFDVKLPEDLNVELSKASADTGLGILYFIASKADIFDTQGDMIELPELKKAAFSFVKRSRKGDRNHNYKKSAEVVESFVFDEKIIELIKSGEIQAGDWVVGMQPLDPDLLDKAQKGLIKGASIAGRAKKEAVRNA